MNTERFVIQNVTGTEVYINKYVNFIGTESQARRYAADNNYGGGIEISSKSVSKDIFLEWNHKKKFDFKCPECSGEILNQIQNVITNYPVSSVPICGNVELVYDEPTLGDGEVIGYQCGHCSYELESSGNPIVEPEDLIIWIIENSGK